jgi:hypothetical protein
MRFRSRIKYQDKASALAYFRNLVEAHASGTLDISPVRNLVGLEPSYSPAFEHSLRLIPEEQLSSISWQEPLGKGANGVVYSALWHRPPGILASSQQKKLDEDVVLKDVQSQTTSLQASRNRIIKEVCSSILRSFYLLI